MEKLYHVQFYGIPHHSKINIKQPKFKQKNSKVKLAEKQLNKYLSMMALDKNHAKTIKVRLYNGKREEQHWTWFARDQQIKKDGIQAYEIHFINW